MANKNESVDISNTINVIQIVELLVFYFVFFINFFCKWLSLGLVKTLTWIVMLIPNLLMSIPECFINVYDVVVNDASFQIGTFITALFVVLNIVGFIIARIRKN